MNSKHNKMDKKKASSKPFDIPVEGSIGLLALGAVGLKAWRKARDQAKKDTPDKNA